MFNSKRKKLEKQMAIEAEMQARINREAAAAEVGANKPRQPRASVRLMHNCGPVPIAPPADFVQLTPIVQPIPLVPYSTQEQPLLTFDEYDYED